MWRKCLLTLPILLFIISVFSQTEAPETDFIIADDDSDLENLSNLESLLYDLSLNPLDLNSITEADLEAIYFLNDFQRKSIIYFLENNRPLQTIYELQFCLGLDAEIVQRILPLVCVKPIKSKINISDLVHSIRQNVLMKTKLQLQTDDVYFNFDTTDVGSPEYMKLKYNISASDMFEAGFTIEKDVGENYINPQTNNLDFVSEYAQIRFKRYLKKIIIGDYAASFGQGLIANSGFGFGKSSSTTNVRKTNEIFRPYTASNENRYFRGVATEWRLGKIFIDVAMSSNRLDAEIDTASAKASSVATDDTHNTLLKVSRTNQLKLSSTLARIAYSSQTLRIAFNSAIHKFADTIAPSDLIYKKYNFADCQLSDYSCDWLYNYRKLFLWGELATDMNLHTAMIFAINIEPVDELFLTMSYRNYNKAFNAINNSAFSEYSGVANESGFYLGIEKNIGANTKLSAYYDIFQSPWLRYNTCAPSIGNEQLLCLKSKPNRKFSYTTQYKRENKQITCNDSVVDFLVNVVRHNFKLQTKLILSEKIILSSTLLCGKYVHEIHSDESSYYIGQNISWQQTDRLKHKLQFAVFDATYNSRIYAYENDVSYSISSAMICNRGARCGYVMNLKIGKYLTTEMRLLHIIKSADEDLQHSTSATIQLRAKF